MDKKKCVWPRYDFPKRPHDLENLKPRPRMTLTGALAHGWCTAFFDAPETLSHGADAFLEVLCITLSKVWDMCQVQGRRFPLHLVIQTDNTVAQTKNSLCAAFFCHMVGHTHEDIDQLFGMVTEQVVRKHRWETPAEFRRLLSEVLGPSIRAHGHAMLVQGLRPVREFTKWLQPHKVSLDKCWGGPSWVRGPPLLHLQAAVGSDSKRAWDAAANSCCN